MHITFLCPDLRVSGGVRVILAFADRLAGRGHHVEVVVPAWRRLKVRWRSLRRPRPEWLPRFRARIRWIVEWRPAEFPPGDVLVASTWRNALAVAEAAPVHGAKYYLVQHDESLYHGPPDTVDAAYRLPLRKIVVSTWLRDILQEKFGQHAEVVIPPIDPDLFHRLPVAITSPRPRILMLHHEAPWKGVTEGMEVIAMVKRNVPRLHLVGFGLRRPGRHTAFDEFHVNPSQGDLARLYSGCDIYLCPSWDEGLGLPSMEAMACGAALVTYDTGGCRDYAKDGETALVARQRDVAELAAKLERLALDTELRTRIAAAGSAFVRSAFHWDHALQRMEDLFRTGYHPA